MVFIHPRKTNSMQLRAVFEWKMQSNGEKQLEVLKHVVINHRDVRSKCRRRLLDASLEAVNVKFLVFFSERRNCRDSRVPPALSWIRVSSE